MRWSSEGKRPTIGSEVGIRMNHWGVSPCCTNPPVAHADHRNDTHTPRNATESHPHPQPSPIIWGNQCGPDDRDCHTQLRRTIVPKKIAAPLAPAVHQGQTSRRYGHARRRPTPAPRCDAQTTRRASAIVLYVLRRPTCPQSNTIGRNQAGMHPQQRKHIGANPPYGEDTPDRRQVQRKEKEGGTSAKGSVLMLSCVPLPHLVLPLSGCACSGTPTMATRGEARGHP